MNRINHLLIITILAFSSLTNSTIAQDIAIVKDVDLLKEQTDVLIRQYPHLFEETKIIGIKEIDPSHSIIQYTKGNEYYETIVNSGRKDMLLIATCRAIDESKAPEIIEMALQKDGFSLNQVQNYFIVNTPYKSNFYRVDINETEAKKSVYYDKLGQYTDAPY